MKYLPFILIALLLLVIGCAGTRRQTENRTRYFITYDEIKKQYQAHTAWDIVSNLRPNLLDRDSRRWVGFKEALDALCYLDGMPFGNKENLKKIIASSVMSIRYIDGFQANPRYGPTAVGGIFFVTSLK